MGRRLIVDTSVLVAAEPGVQSLRGVVLLIAATVVATGRTVLTIDAQASFHDLPGVASLVVGSGSRSRIRVSSR